MIVNRQGNDQVDTQTQTGEITREDMKETTKTIDLVRLDITMTTEVPQEQVIPIGMRQEMTRSQADTGMAGTSQVATGIDPSQEKGIDPEKIVTGDTLDLALVRPNITHITHTSIIDISLSCKTIIVAHLLLLSSNVPRELLAS